MYISAKYDVDQAQQAERQTIKNYKESLKHASAELQRYKDNAFSTHDKDLTLEQIYIRRIKFYLDKEHLSENALVQIFRTVEHK